MNKKKLLITGGSGLVGKHLKAIFPEGIYPSRQECDLSDINRIKDVLKQYTPDIVIHLAAKVGGIQDNIKKPAEFFDDNILINTNILKATYEQGIGRFVGILTTCMYPDQVDHYPMAESDIFSGPPNAMNFSYAYAKRCLAVQIEAYNKQYGTQYNYLIPCNLYSEMDNFEEDDKMHFITALLKKIKDAKGTIPLLGTGKPLRQFLYAGDLARVIKEVVNRDITESFNVAPDYNYSINTMAEMALEVLGKEDKIVYSDPHLDGQYRKDVSAEKMLSLIPDFRFTDFKEGIKRTYDKIS